MSVELQKRKLTVKEYYQMAEVGILKPDERVELIAGEIIKMAPIGIPDAGCVRRLNGIFNKLLSGKAIVDAQNPIDLNNESEPQPDLVLLKWRDDYYAEKHPQPEDILLLVEVADSSIKYDREVKVDLYAENGICEVWLININQQLVEVYRQPVENSYQYQQQFSREQNLTIQAFEDINLSVDEILGG
ncbi:MAG: Uma2 family endonuclease [Okeania sp. SIO3B5]|uniref:Uma2 family endonuclease n=1 Tax=Okeania sp. SIO3B5 TaxID=2607811 RepID=UPI00140162C6|nr:Uma2 family endonuclease [Okeania sp. SIO3B5]NEO56847.1 Uma2 family endonuclease [Okeania sp. SIO3B5]